MALTRLLSALLVSDWVGPVLASAFLGLGLGAAAASASATWRSPRAALLGAALGAVVATLSVPAWLAAAAAGRPLLGLLGPVLAYAGIGVALAGIFARHARHAPSLYRADLAAAALAAAATPVVLGALGGLQGTLAAALVLAVAAWSLADARTRPLAVAATAVAGLAFAAAALGILELQPRLLGAAKPIAAMLARGGEVEATRWDATARTDMVRLPDGSRYLFMDGGAGSLVPDPDPNRWWRDVGAFAFAAAVAEAPRVYLIGPGGGLDVAQARVHGAGEIVAVEVNRASVELVRGLGPAAAGVYDDATRVIVGDGRRELARLAGSFDVITLANVVTQAAELRGAALTENRVYTLEALQSYLARLTPEGHVALTLYDELTLTRALTTALDALVRGGWADDHAAAVRHVLAVMDATASPAVPILLVRQRPFTRDEAIAAARIAEARGWALLLVPGLLAPPSVARLADGEWTLADLIAAGGDVDLAPTTDERPYFFAFETGVPRDVQRAGAAALLVALALGALAPVVGRASRHAGGPAAGARRFASAAALGAGFLALELHALPIVQRAAGHPSWSLAITLGAVLLGAAIGAGLARRGGSVRRSAALTAAAIIVWTLAAPALALALDPWPPLAAAAVVGAALVLVGVPMGMPFPRLLATWGVPIGVAAALAASGVAAVAAGGAATWLGHAVGTSAIGWAAAAVYAVAGAIHPASATRLTPTGHLLYAAERPREGGGAMAIVHECSHRHPETDPAS